MKTKSQIQELMDAYVYNGLKIIPLDTDNNPIYPYGPNLALNDIDDIDSVFSRYKNAGVGIVTGNINRIVVVSIDYPVEPVIKNIENIYGPLPFTFSVLTRNGGRQFFYKIPEGKILLQSVKGHIFGMDYPFKIHSINDYVVGPYTDGYFADVDDAMGMLLFWDYICDMPSWILEITSR